MERFKHHLKAVVFILFLTGFISGSWAAPVITNIAVTHATCFDNGRIDITATGNPPLSYIIFDFFGQGVHFGPQNQNYFEGLPPGTYTVGVYETAVPEQLVTETVTVLGSYQQITPRPATSGTSTNICVSGSYITLNWDNGRAPFTATITNNSSPFNTQTVETNNQTYTFSGLPNGSYSFRVEDACENSFNSTSNITINATGSSGFTLDGLPITNVVRQSVGAHYTQGLLIGNCNSLRFNFHQDHNLIATSAVPAGVTLGSLFTAGSLTSIELGIEYPPSSGIIGWTTMTTAERNPWATINNYEGLNGNQTYRVAVKNPCTGAITFSQVYTMPTYLGFRMTATNVPKIDYCTPDPQMLIDLQTSGTITQYACDVPYTIALYEAGTNQLIGTKTGVETTVNVTATFSPYLGDPLVEGNSYYAVITGNSGWSQTTTTLQAVAMTPFADRLTPATIFSGILANQQMNYRSCDYNTTTLGILLNQAIPLIPANAILNYSLSGKTGTPTEGITRPPVNGYSMVTIWNDLPWGEYTVTATSSCTSAVKEVNIVAPVDDIWGELSYTGTSVCGYYNITGKGGFLLNGEPVVGLGTHLLYAMKITDAPNPALIGTTSPVAGNGISNNGSYTILNNVPPGTYKVVFFAAYASDNTLSCFPEVTITIPEYSPPFVDVFRSGGHTCGDATADMLVTMSQGTQLPLQFRWKILGAPDASYSAFQLSNVFPSMLPGDYTIQVRDACNYTVTQNLHLLTTGDQIIGINGQVMTGVICSTREVMLYARSVGPVEWFLWEYSIDGNSWTTISDQPTYTIPYATTADLGYYRLSVYNGRCELQSTVQFTTLMPPSEPPSITGAAAICPGGSAVLTANNTTAYVNPSYQWYKDGTLIEFAEFATYTATAVGSYTVTVTPYEGCPSDPSAAHIVALLPEPELSDFSADVACSGTNPVIHVGASLSGITYSVYTLSSGGSLVGSGLGNGSAIDITLSDFPATNTTYYIETAIAGSCVSSARVPITITVNPLSTTANITANNTTICNGQSVNLTTLIAGSPGVTNPVFRWYSSTTITTELPSTTVNPSTTTTYYVSVSGSNFCEGVAGASGRTTVTVTVNDIPAQPDNIDNGTSPVCVNSAQRVYSVPPVPGATSYTWTFPSGWTGSSTTNSINLTPGPSAQTGQITVTANNACGSSVPRTYNVTVVPGVPSQPGIISGLTPVCVGGATQTYSIAEVLTATSYTWTLPSGWTGSSTTNSIDATPGVTAVSGNITVTANNICGNSIAQTFPVVVQGIPAQPSTITGDATVCKGATGLTYFVTNVTGVTYNWVVPAGWSITGGNGTNQITVSVTLTAVSGSITVTPSNNCGDGTPRSIAETVNDVPAQTSAITGSSTVCQNVSGLSYSVQEVSGVTYTWSVPSDWTITGGQDTYSIIVTSGVTTGTISVTPSNDCGDGTPRSMTVTPFSGTGVPPAQPSVILGNTNPCVGATNITYEITNVSGISYIWSVPAGWHITGGNGTNQITVSVTAGAAAGNITVTPSNDCGDGMPRELAVTVNDIPAQPSAIDGSSSVCQAVSGLGYFVTNVSGVTYTWVFPSDWTIDSGQGTHSITVTSGTTGGTISVTPSNACGSGTPSELVVSLSGTGVAPSQPSAILGNANPCTGATGLTYSVDNVSGITYTWSLPAGWTQTGGNTSNSITVTTGTAGGTITVTPSNDCGSGASRELIVTINNVPGQPSVITGNNTVCSGATGLTYSVTGVAGVTYTWSLPIGWTQTGGGTSNSITVTAGTAGGTIVVTPSNVCGSGQPRTFVVAVNNVPAQPSAIAGSSDVCRGNTGLTYFVTQVPGVTYTWSVPEDWTIVAGQNTNSITVTVLSGAVSGDVTVTPSNSCGDGQPRSMFVTVNVCSEMHISKSSDVSTVCNGGEVIFTIVLTNDATIAAQNIELIDVWPSDNLVYKSYTVSDGDYDIFTNTWTIDILEVDAEATLTIFAKAIAAGANINNQIYVSAVDGITYADFADSPIKSEASVTILPLSSANDITTRDTVVCGGVSVDLNLLVGLSGSTNIVNPVFNWYTSITATTPMVSTVVAPTIETTYYVSVSGSDYCEGPASSLGRDSATVILNPYSTASDISVSGTDTICTGGTASLTASAGGVINPVFRWYETATSTIVLFEGATYTTPELIAGNDEQTIYIYHVSVAGDNYCEGEANATGRKAVQVVVNPYSIGSMLISVSGIDTICTGGSTELTASASSVINPIFRWYDIDNNLLFMGETFITAVRTGMLKAIYDAQTPYVYYVSVEGDNYCEGGSISERKEVTVTVNPYSVGSMLISIAGTDTICTGGSTGLTASASSVINPTFRWYDNNSNLLFTGATFDTGVLQVVGGVQTTYTFYVSVEGDNYCEGDGIQGDRKTVIVTVNPYSVGSVLISVAGVDTICAGVSTSLTASASGVTNPTFRWYDSSSNLLFTGATFTTGALGAVSDIRTTYTFYVSVEGDNYCEGGTVGDRKTVTVTVNPYFAGSIQIFFIGSDTICTGSNIELTASASSVINPTFRWYDDNSNLLFTGATFDTGILQAVNNQITYIYYVSVKGDNYCEALIGAPGRQIVPVTVTPFSTASMITLSDTTVCPDTSVDLTATVTGVTNPVFKWYNTPTAPTAFFTGATYTTGALIATATYYVSVEGDNYCEGFADVTGRQSVTVTVNPLSTASTIMLSDTTICVNTSADLTATAPSVTNPVFKWYADATAATAFFTGATYTTGLLTSNATYYVSVSGDNYCEGLANTTGRHAVTVVVNSTADPSGITISGDTIICTGTSTAITAAAGIIINPVFNWYANAADVTPIFTGATFTTGVLTADTTYYVAVSGENYCEGDASVTTSRRAVTIIVNQLSTASNIMISGATAVCNGGFTTLTATANGVTNPVFRWYATAIGTEVIDMGASFVTPNLTSAQSFYVSVSGDNYCEGTANATGRQSVTVTIMPSSTASMISVSGTTICPGYAVILTATAGSVTNPEFKWYANATDATVLFTGANFTTDVLTSTTIYYVSVSGDNYCEGPADITGRQAVTVTVNLQSVSSNIMISGDTVICSGNSTTITASASAVNNPVFRWYATATSTVVLFTGATYTTGSLSAATTYYVSVSGSNYCEGSNDAAGRRAVTVNIYPGVMAPLANTPQRFCGGGTLADLIVTGNNIKWYRSLTDVTALPANTPLVNGEIYYASQSSDICESALRTAVTALITSPIVLDVPLITGSQSFCGAPTLADIATDGSNIKWYDAPLSGNELPLNTPLTDGQSYYAAQVAGACESPNRTIVTVTISGTLPNSPAMITPQVFCSGALIANLNVPNNQILWYADPTGGTALSPGAELQAATYYAAQRAGSCESFARSAVVVTLDSLAAPDARGLQTICDVVNGTLADLQVSGSGIVWYATAVLNDPLPLNTPLAAGATYYAVQMSETCVSRPAAVSVTDECYTIRGTIFPFVHEAGNDEFNALFPVIVKLTALPAPTYNPVGAALRLPVLYTAAAVYYDGSIYVPGTPKHPGRIGLQNNPGERIRWQEVLNKVPGIPDNTPVSGIGDVPDAPVGLFTFINIVPGDYLLHITRKGYVTRFVKITVNNSIGLGHRELLAGDVNGDIVVDPIDLSSIKARISYIGLPNYTPWFDLNADGSVDNEGDRLIILSNLGANVEIYEDTYDWMDETIPNE